MNEISNKFLLAGDKVMPEMHLKQPGFTIRKFQWTLYKKKKTEFKTLNRRYKLYLQKRT